MTSLLTKTGITDGEWIRSTIDEARRDPVGMWRMVRAGREQFALYEGEMDESLHRQLSLIQQAVVDYRGNLLSLNQLVCRIEAIGNAIGGELWDQQLFEIVVDLERINSELIDKHRQMTLLEQERVNGILGQLEAIASR